MDHRLLTAAAVFAALAFPAPAVADQVAEVRSLKSWLATLHEPVADLELRVPA